MKLRHGRVLVETVRQSQRRTYTSAVGHEFRLTQLKESNLRFQASNHSYFVPIPEDQDKHETFITPDVRYEILHTDYQEVEVSGLITLQIFLTWFAVKTICNACFLQEFLTSLMLKISIITRSYASVGRVPEEYCSCCCCCCLCVCDSFPLIC